MSNKINKQDEIVILDNEVTAVRQLPDVYIGALGNHGFKNMYREIVQNSLDEIIKGNTLDKNIIISYDNRTHTCIIEDNGQGIDLSKLVQVFSVLHSSSNYNKKEGSGKYSSGKNGMGATITNFLSRFFKVESYRPDGTAAKVEFEEGIITKKGLQSIKCPKGKHGMITTFAPSAMMGDITVTVDDLEYLTWLMVNLCVPGTKIYFSSIDRMGRTKKTMIENKNGIYDILGNACERQLMVPIYYTKDNGTMKVEVLLTYDTTNMDDPIIYGFANMCPCSTGTHVDGFLDGVVKYFRDYMNKIYLANNKKLTVNAQDVRTGLRAVVSVFHLFPMFTGQAKETFSKEDMKPYVYENTIKALDEWAAKNPADLQKICKYLKEVCTIRTKSDDQKVKMSTKYESSAITGLPVNFKQPNKLKGSEIIITEGKSAAPENSRDKNTQGIIGIRGKMLNPFTTPTKKYFENEEVSGLFAIFGYNGYSKTFDPDKFLPSKIIIATDADADGCHIRCLVFGMFLRYLPFVIERGMLYSTTPPLYGINVGKKMKFFANNIDYIEYVYNSFYKDNKITTTKGRTLSKSEVIQILNKNMYYKDTLQVICDNYFINMYLLEAILYNKDCSFAKLSNALKKQFRFIELQKQNGYILISGLVEQKSQTIFLNDRFLNECKEAIQMIEESDKYYNVNGTPITLLGLMNLFSSYEPANITRYKGLGEMPVQMLAESTIMPGMGRTLKQYTIDDAKKELKYITQLQSDKSIFIRDLKIRKEDIV